MLQTPQSTNKLRQGREASHTHPRPILTVRSRHGREHPKCEKDGGFQKVPFEAFRRRSALRSRSLFRCGAFQLCNSVKEGRMTRSHTRLTPRKTKTVNTKTVIDVNTKTVNTKTVNTQPPSLSVAKQNDIPLTLVRWLTLTAAAERDCRMLRRPSASLGISSTSSTPSFQTRKKYQNRRKECI